MFGRNPLLALQAGRNLTLGRGEQITPKAIVQATACLTVATQLARYERPGWTVIATDVWGLPWRGVHSRPDSHGTWAQHDACGITPSTDGPLRASLRRYATTIRHIRFD